MDYRAVLNQIKIEIMSHKRLPGYLMRHAGMTRHDSTLTIVMIVEGSDWVIGRIGDYMRRNISSSAIKFVTDFTPKYHTDSIIHFGSLNTFVGRNRKNIHRSNKCVLTLYHGDFGINARMDSSLRAVIDNQHILGKIVVSTSIMKNRLSAWGVAPDKIVVIPIGVDCDAFRPMQGGKEKLREQLGIPPDAYCIGSFQKDGNGWGEGLEPKLIKGPDVFVDVVHRLHKKRKIHCLLTGPARGYVKNALVNAGIPFTHKELPNYLDIVPYYSCLDLYVVTSREEGGPQAILESMATGTPVVSTRVGMAPDIMVSGVNGFVTEIDDVDDIVEKSGFLLDDVNLRNTCIINGIATATRYSWDQICRQYISVYETL